jgi:ribosomal-protein-alanine N-acetyltransferase
MSAVRATRIDADDLEVRIAPMRRRHLRGVLAIESQVYPRPWTLGLFMSELALRTSRLYLVARVGTRVVGYAGVMFVVGEAHITTIAVDPAWHRVGIGTRLMLTLTRQSIQRGATSLTLEVRLGNHGAQELYRRFGLAPAGVRKRYYVESNEDALIMWAYEIDSPEFQSRLDGIERGLSGSTVLEHL